MEFCKRCGKPLKIKEDISKCDCGIIKLSNSKLSSREKIKKPEKRGKGVAKEEKIKKGFPHECKKCGYVEREAYGTSNK